MDIMSTKRSGNHPSGSLLVAKKERGISHDRFAVVLTVHDSVLVDVMVGQVPREFSKVAYHFITHGGCISCEVTGSRRQDTTARLGLYLACTDSREERRCMVDRLRDHF